MKAWVKRDSRNRRKHLNSPGGPGLLGTLLGPGLSEDAEDTLVLARPRPLPAGILFSSIISPCDVDV